MKTNLEEIMNIREAFERYDGEECDYELFKNCECMLHNLRERMSHVLDIAMHIEEKEELENKYWELEKEYNELYEELKPYMLAVYDGYKEYSERCNYRYNNVIDYRHGDDYFMNEMAREIFNN